MERKIQKRIGEYRKERGLTLRQLAERAGCTPSYISQLEKGLTVPSLSMVGKLASALHIPVIDLFSDLSNGEDGTGKLWAVINANPFRISGDRADLIKEHGYLPSRNRGMN